MSVKMLLLKFSNEFFNILRTCREEIRRAEKWAEQRAPIGRVRPMRDFCFGISAAAASKFKTSITIEESRHLDVGNGPFSVSMHFLWPKEQFDHLPFRLRLSFHRSVHIVIYFHGPRSASEYDLSPSLVPENFGGVPQT